MSRGAISADAGAAQVLARAQAAGLTLEQTTDGLKIRGPQEARETLRAELVSNAGAIARLLAGGSLRRQYVLKAWAAAQDRLSNAARGTWPLDGYFILRWVRPDAADRLDGAEVEALAAAQAHVSGAPPTEFDQALARWERLHLDAIHYLARTCSECGRECPVAVLLDDGRRFCRRCLSTR